MYGVTRYSAIKNISFEIFCKRWKWEVKILDYWIQPLLKCADLFRIEIFFSFQSVNCKEVHVTAFLSTSFNNFLKCNPQFRNAL